jgi:dephospho-CoA kinase
MMKKRKVVIGVTGTFAAGKSTVAAEFKALGAFLIDADMIARDLLENDECIKKYIELTFGPAVIKDGAVDRAKLAAIVFSNQEKLDRLCEITHPAILERIHREIAGSGNEVVVVDAPLLFETGLDEEMDTVVVVTAKEEKRIERAKAKGISEVISRRIMACQMSPEDKIKKADHLIINDEGIEKIKEGVKKVWQKK